MPIPALLFLLGLILLVIEILIPGFGIFGVSGILCLGISALLLAQTYGIWIVFVMIALLALVVWILYKTMKKNKIAGKLILEECIDSQAFDDTSYLSLMGKEGVSVTPLKPGGKADFDGRIVEVFSNGEFISKGHRVKVICVSGKDITVREIKKEKETAL